MLKWPVFDLLAKISLTRELDTRLDQKSKSPLAPTMSYYYDFSEQAWVWLYKYKFLLQAQTEVLSLQQKE